MNIVNHSRNNLRKLILSLILFFIQDFGHFSEFKLRWDSVFVILQLSLDGKKYMNLNPWENTAELLVTLFLINISSLMAVSKGFIGCQQCEETALISEKDISLTNLILGFDSLIGQ